jgi:hypothetical protein
LFADEVVLAVRSSRPRRRVATGEVNYLVQGFRGGLVIQF